MQPPFCSVHKCFPTWLSSASHEFRLIAHWGVFCQADYYSWVTCLCLKKWTQNVVESLSAFSSNPHIQHSLLFILVCFTERHPNQLVKVCTNYRVDPSHDSVLQEIACFPLWQNGSCHFNLSSNLQWNPCFIGSNEESKKVLGGGRNTVAVLPVLFSNTISWHLPP